MATIIGIGSSKGKIGGGGGHDATKLDVEVFNKFAQDIENSVNNKQDKQNVWKGTLNEYNSLEIKDENTFYCISADYDFENKYFGVYAVEDGTVKINHASKAPAITLQYSVNNTDNWQPFSLNTNYNIAKGDIMYIKGVNNNFCQNRATNSFVFGNKVELLGNIMSMIYGDDFASNKVIPNAQLFNSLFIGQANIISIDNLRLSATTLKIYCYFAMFENCTGLTTLPEKLLPATTLEEGVYNYMFYGCTGLTELPEKLLPATTLTDWCYGEMFYGCSKLKSIPENFLPATTLAWDCYEEMFAECIGLIELPEKLLPANPKGYSYAWMFYACSNLTKSPIIKVNDLSDGPIEGMFKNCTKLKEVTLICNTIKSDNTIGKDWLLNTSENGVINIPETATLDATVVRNASGVPETWTINKIAI